MSSSHSLPRPAAAWLAAALLAAGAAQAQELRTSGFGTVSAVRTDHDGAQYRIRADQGRGADESVDYGVDSNLGLQANATFGERFSAVGQLLTARKNSANIRPRIEWLYLQGKLADGVDLRAGRLVMPVFLLSDSRNVGYAAHWLRAPLEVYGIYSLSSFDGVQGVLQHRFGDTSVTAQLSAGRSEGKLYTGLTGDITGRRIRGLSVTAEQGDWTVRVGQTVISDLQMVFDATPLGLGTIALPTVRDKFTSYGLQYDDGTRVVLAEYAVRRQDTGGADSNSGYVSAGWRFGKVLPYATFGSLNPKGNQFTFSGIRTTKAVGARWDAARNIALKAQFENTERHLQFINETPAFTASDQRVNVTSVSLDFVF
jgi:hypothetical protein